MITNPSLGDPDIYINNKRDILFARDKNSQKCTNFGFDICNINSTFIDSNTEIYIGILCLITSCDFSIEVSKEIIKYVVLDKSTEFDIKFRNSEEQIIKFFISEELNNISRIVFEAY